MKFADLPDPEPEEDEPLTDDPEPPASNTTEAVKAPTDAPPAAAPVAFDPYKDAAQTAAYARTLRNQQAPPAPSPAASPAVSQATHAPQNTPVSAAPNDSGQTRPPAELMQILAAYGGLVLNALNSGQRGCDFADWLVQGFGGGTHAMISQQGEPALAQAMMAIPELAVFGEGRLQKFAHEFINYDSILDGEDDGTDEDQAETAASRRA